jgi:hypothetical protein
LVEYKGGNNREHLIPGGFNGMCDKYGQNNGHVPPIHHSGSHPPGEFSLINLRKNGTRLSVTDSFFLFIIRYRVGSLL